MNHLIQNIKTVQIYIYEYDVYDHGSFSSSISKSGVDTVNSVELMGEVIVSSLLIVLILVGVIVSSCNDWY